MQIKTLGIDGRSASWSEIDVACAWLPQLPLRVEVLRRPAWDGRPLVLGSRPGERKVVQLCSPEARNAGIYPGLPLREVLPLCHEAIIIQPDPVRVAAALEEVLNKLQQVSPVLELQEDQIFLDLRGLRGIYWGDLGMLERAIRAAIPPLLRPRLGVASGKFPAAAAARLAPPSGLGVVQASETAGFLAPLPISYLPLPPNMLQRLDLLGLHTMADLTALPFAAVQAEFGPLGARAWRLASGHDNEPIIPRRFSLAVCASLCFDDPLASIDAVVVALNHLLARAFSNPALRGRAVRQVRLRALLANGTSWERLITFKDALSSRDSAYRVLKNRIELLNILPPAPIEELSLELMGLCGEAAKQLSLFAARLKQLDQIAEAARQLRARYGYVPLYYAVEVEPWSRIPERRWALVPYNL
ncbi:MAG: DNA polymerase Y family protein [Actinobacteria bacterium]|nr:DNA polymerase Y family protein [Actinomycetota bacterium]